MWRSRVRCLRKPAARLSTAAHASRRTFGGYGRAVLDTFPLRVVGPTVWSITAVGTIYLGCAGWEVYHEVQDSRIGSDGIYDHLQAARWNTSHRGWDSGWNRSHVLTLADLVSPALSWNRLIGADKMVVGAIGLNTGIFAMSQFFGRLKAQLMHIPSVPSNYTLLASNFAHTGFLSLAANMYCLFLFGPQVARSYAFERSGPHLTAFYLAAGILSTLGQHLSSKRFPLRGPPVGFLTPSLGASGAIFALFGASGTLFPDAQLKVLFVPGSVRADSVLMTLALFEAFGLVFGLPILGFQQAAHLTGLAVGSGYVYFDGKRRVWEPTKRFMFNGMKRLGVV